MPAVRTRPFPKSRSLPYILGLMALASAAACDTADPPKKPATEPATAAVEESKKELATPATPATPATRLSLNTDEVCQGLLGKPVYDVFFPDRPDDYSKDVSSRFMEDVCILMLATHSDDGMKMESVTLQVVNAEEYDGMAAMAIFESVTRAGPTKPTPAEIARLAELEKTADAVVGKGEHQLNAKERSGQVGDRKTTPIPDLGQAGAVVQEERSSDGGPQTMREVYFVVQDTVFRLHSQTVMDAEALTRAAKLIAPGLAKLSKPS